MIRPFSLGDLFLLQQLGRYATQLHIEKNLLQPRSSMLSALRACLPWGSGSCITYVLRQQENGLARAGVIQIEVRPNRSEADVVLLTPALDAPQGYPAIWQKLLGQSIQALVERQIVRLYTNLPDQPLPVNTFKQAGFQLYTRETIWRLAPLRLDGLPPVSASMRPQRAADDWHLLRLYRRITPAPVQQAEGAIGIEKEYNGGSSSPLTSRIDDLPASKFVLEGDDGLLGCLHLLWGRIGIWIRVWVDTNDPNQQAIYIAVRDYQIGIESVLADFGFAPFTDRACMVRSIWQWAHRPAPIRMPALETVREAVPGSLAVHKAISKTIGNEA